jgi:hypothetical protein
MSTHAFQVSLNASPVFSLVLEWEINKALDGEKIEFLLRFGFRAEFMGKLAKNYSLIDGALHEQHHHH